MADPLEALDPWCDDDRLTAAQHIIDNGTPETESERSSLALAFGEELNVIDLAAAQLRVLRDKWCALLHPTAAVHREGMAELAEEEYDLKKARHVYRCAITRLRLTAERKGARAKLLDAVVAFIGHEFHSGPGDDQYDALYHAVNEFRAMRPTSEAAT